MIEIDNTQTPVENDDMVTSIASLILGGGIIAFVFWKWKAIELLNIFLIVILPFTLLAVALRLISWATFKAVWNFDLRERISNKVNDIREEMDKEEGDNPLPSCP